MAEIEIQEPSDSVKVPDLEVQGARKLGNVIAHLHMRVKNSTKVFNKRRAFDFNIIKDEGEMFKVLIVSSRRCDEELCFIRVHHQLVSNHPCLQLLHTTLQFEKCAS